MKPIVITPEILDPVTTLAEIDAITRIINQFGCNVHIRKKGCDILLLTKFVNQITERVDSSKLVIHYHPDIALSCGLGGLHLSFHELKNISQQQLIQLHEKFMLSVSCHTLSEIETIKSDYNGVFRYLFLSPIFNSISKSGYNAAFDLVDIEKNITKNKISQQCAIIALGGVDSENVGAVSATGFDGAALLGAVWRGGATHAVPNYKKIFDQWQKRKK